MNRLLFALGTALVLVSTASAQPVRTNRFTATTPKTAQRWQHQARERLFAAMMGGSRPPRVPLQATVLQRLEAPGGQYLIEEVAFQSLPDRRIKVWLALPKRTGRRPAVLALHGHGGTGLQVVRGEGLYAYGRELAERGFVVIAPDVGQHEVQHPGWSLMGERTWDALRCLDYLETRPEVDATRLAVAGLSLGGETTMYVAALDDRIRAACSSGWLTTIANMKNQHCPCWNFPGLEEQFDFADIFACVAPRPLVLEIGEQERAPGGFPVEIARPAFAEIRAAYAVFNATSNVILDIHPAGHVFHGEGFWPVLDRALGVGPEERRFLNAARNGHFAREAFERCRRYVDGWLARADPETGLIPRNFRESRDFWNGRDAAADNYPFMVLTAAMTDRPLFHGRMLDMLRTEERLTSRVGRLPDDYSFSKRGWRREKIELDQIIFDGAEYVKDGLLPLTEWLGPSPWSERMIGIMEDLWANAQIETPFGRIPTLNLEVNGDLLQACSRLFWFTGRRQYLDWAVRLGDFYLLGTNHPTRHLRQVRLEDHGCEIVNGLSELYVAVARARPDKRGQYREPLHELYESILAKGRNPDGLLYTWFNPQTGEHAPDLCDTWGYNFDGLYTLWLVDGTREYRDAVRHALANLHGKYVGACWRDKGADGFADSIEGALNLFNREPIPSVAAWLDSQTRLMWDKQQPDGVIEGWHGDGNFARTSLMVALWKTQGLTIEPWRADVRFGAVREGNRLFVTLESDQPWQGKLIFDRPRHKEHMRLPLDYPRINQFPEWFVVAPDARCRVRTDGGRAVKHPAATLREGLPVTLTPGRELRLEVEVR
ncbi:MAG: alpha/beta hydrolase family protein [Verrucomicrobiales bacterium]|nr:alpha/beta hydrolase family protein [Verrucomicrobiales bacterium]